MIIHTDREDWESGIENSTLRAPNTDLEDLESRIEYLELERNRNSENNASSGIFMLIYFPGLALAMILSYLFNQSILWAVLHGYLSWWYVVYFAIFKS